MKANALETLFKNLSGSEIMLINANGAKQS